MMPSTPPPLGRKSGLLAFHRVKVDRLGAPPRVLVCKSRNRDRVPGRGLGLIERIIGGLHQVLWQGAMIRIPGQTRCTRPGSSALILAPETTLRGTCPARSKLNAETNPFLANVDFRP